MKRFLEQLLYSLLGAAFGLIIGILMFAALSSCTTTRPRPAEVPPLTALHPDSLSPEALGQLPAYLVPPPPGSTSAQQRKWHRAQRRNLVRAGVAPRTVKIKHSALATAPGATAATIGKAKAPVATGTQAAATDQRKAAQRGGALAAGDQAQASATTQRPFPWWIVAVVVVLLGLNKLVRGRWFL